MKNILNLFLVLGLLIPPFTIAKEVSWQESMQELSKVLTDVFPFLYSRSEFHDPKNKEILLKSFKNLSTVAHKLPAGTGKELIGSKPLFNEIKDSVNNDLKKAQDLLNSNKFDMAQTVGQHAIQKCFACHTTVQYGPNYPPTNSEVMNVSTPFGRSKIVVFGALRQFRGALEVIDKDIRKLNETQKLDFAKLHMVVSLRALQDYDGAQEFLASLKKASASNKKMESILNQWIIDVKSWKEKPTELNSSTTIGNHDSDFINNLHSTVILHNQSAEVSADERAKIFYKLGKTYQTLELSEFSDLPKIYFTACTQEKASPAAKEPCEKAL